MKIGNPDSNKATVGPIGNDRGTDDGTKAKPRSGEAGAGEPSATVDLSVSAAALAAAGSEFDADKVDRIAQAIRDGRYKINAEAIADKLIANAKEVLGRVKR